MKRLTLSASRDAFKRMGKALLTGLKKDTCQSYETYKEAFLYAKAQPLTAAASLLWIGANAASFFFLTPYVSLPLFFASTLFELAFLCKEDLKLRQRFSESLKSSCKIGVCCVALSGLMWFGHQTAVRSGQKTWLPLPFVQRPSLPQTVPALSPRYIVHPGEPR